MTIKVGDRVRITHSGYYDEPLVAGVTGTVVEVDGDDFIQIVTDDNYTEEGSNVWPFARNFGDDWEVIK
jgi:hypothetical protein